jgi:hypothetical protein
MGPHNKPFGIRRASQVTGALKRISNKVKRKRRIERMKALENYGGPLAPTEQSSGQSYSKLPYNGR